MNGPAAGGPEQGPVPAPVVVSGGGSRKPRIAVLVFNDCHADTRVLKTAGTLARAGADVRIFAVARPTAGYPAGVQRLEPGVVLERLPLVDLGRLLAPAVRVHRRLTASGPAMPDGGEATQHAGPRAAGEGAGTGRSGRIETLVRRLGRSRPVRTVLLPMSAVVLLSYWRAARSAVTAWGPDVVHANDGNTLRPAFRVSRALRVPFVYDSHELWLHRNVAGRRSVARAVERRIERQGIRAAAAVVTVSPSIAEHLRATYRLPTTPVLVRNIPPADQTASGPSAGRMRALAGLPAEAKVLAYGGRITTNRGLEQTVDALEHLADDVHLVVLGYGVPGYVGSLADRARQVGVSDRVHFVGAVPPAEVSGALSDADASVVFVRPTCLSYRWSLPNKLFESIHSGVPVVAADLPDTRRIVEEYGVGEIFTSDSASEMASTIARVIADPVPYQHAARRAATHLTWEAESDRLLGAYRDTLGPRWQGVLGGAGS